MTATSPNARLGDHPPLIYIVDDDGTILELLSACLEEAGYVIQAFDNPVAALGAFILADPKPDLLIMDQRMPEMSGLELLRRCRALTPTLKVLSVSGTLTADQIEETDEKPDGYLRKPFTIAQLLAKVVSTMAGGT